MKHASLIIDVAIAITTGVLTSFWTSGINSLIIGTISFFSIELIRLRISIEEVLELYGFVNQLINALKPHDKVSELALIYGLRSLSKLTDGSIWVPKDDIWIFWKDCIGRAENKISIISYGSLEDTWNLRGWRESALAVQAERIKNGCKIERIFCIESEFEKETLKGEMLSQQNIGIEVGYVIKEELLSNSVLKGSNLYIGTLDLMIIDDSWVTRGHLDNNRNFLGASASRDKDILSKASFLFREARKIAKRDFNA